MRTLLWAASSTARQGYFEGLGMSRKNGLLRAFSAPNRCLKLPVMVILSDAAKIAQIGRERAVTGRAGFFPRGEGLKAPLWPACTRGISVLRSWAGHRSNTSHG